MVWGRKKDGRNELNNMLRRDPVCFLTMPIMYKKKPNLR